MQILMIHKFLRMVGGTEQYFADLKGILTEHGHSTVPFSLKHPDNPDTPYEEYFLDDVDYQDASPGYRLRNAPRILGRTLYSFEARNKLSKLIDDTRPDLAHLQLIDHHISPSILHTLRKKGIPIVQSVNTYKHVCGSYRLYLFDKQEICTRCLYGKHYHAIAQRCVKGSLAASALASFEMYLHQALKIYHLINRFIVPNEFMKEKLVGAGYDERKIVKLYNPLDLASYTPHYDFEDYVLYFGRIDAEKGVLDLVKAMQAVPGLRLVIVGKGNQLSEIQGYIEQHAVSNVTYVGPKWGSELTPFLQKARMVVVPSVWHEVSPMVIYQAFATGKPVIGTRVGGIPDLIRPTTGVLVSPGNIGELGEALKLAQDDARISEMGRAARTWAETNLDPASYYQALMNVYSDAEMDAK